MSYKFKDPRSAAKGFNIGMAEMEVRILTIELEMDTEYSYLSKLSPEEKTKREIKDRIMNGVTKEEKVIVNEFKKELFTKIYKYFISNNTPRCPFTEYSKILEYSGIRPHQFFEMVARNDGATYRWEKRLGEWEGFTRESATNRIRFLRKEIERVQESKRRDSADYPVENIFDGGLC